MMRQNIEDEADRRLRIRSQQVSATLWPGPIPPSGNDITSSSLDLAPLAGLGARSLYVRVLDRNRVVVATSAGLQNVDLRVLNSGSAQPLPTRSIVTDVDADLDEVGRIQMLTSPIRSADGQVIGLLQVGQSRAAVDQTLHALQLRLVLLGAGALLIAAGSGWLVAKRGLRPLSTMSSRAQDLADRRDFAGRLAVHGTDEVGKLGATIDGLLETLDANLRQHQTFLVDTSHELRNPLFAVRTNLDLLGRLPSGETRDDCLREASNQVERMSRLVSELLLLARTEATQIIELGAVSLPVLLDKVVTEGRKRADGQLVDLSITSDATVLGDAARLEQIFSNLLDNALRYTAATGTIVFAVRQDGEGWTEVDVQDDGIGIASDDLPRIFERFYRVDERASDGTGLGLAIVKHLVQLHGGSIEVQSYPGRGTRFTVRLPLLDLVSTADQQLIATG